MVYVDIDKDIHKGRKIKELQHEMKRAIHIFLINKVL